MNELVMLRRRIAEWEASEAEENKEIRDQLGQSEKKTALGQLARGIGHELRNSLGAIKNATYFLNMALEEPESEVKEALSILEKNVTRSEKIINSLLVFTHTKPLKSALSPTSMPKNIGRDRNPGRETNEIL